MKKILVVLVTFALLISICHAALTYGPTNYQLNKGFALQGKGTADPIYNFIN